MKRVIQGVVLVFVLLTLLVAPTMSVSAAEEEVWDCASFANGIATVSYRINLTNLKTVEFYLVNNSDWPLYFCIHSGDFVPLGGKEATVAPHTSVTMPWVVNFQRLPKTDPDDPDSIRYPKDTQFYARWG